jgi:putative CocE/NonD family hydrolase
MLRFTGPPLAEAVELAGHPLVSLSLACDQADAALHLYLEDVDPVGRCRYVTEGMLRLLHRATAEAPARLRVVGPYRSFTRAAARPVVPGEAMRIDLALLPVAWRFAVGHRIRLAVAGADADHFAQVPHGRPPTFDIACGGGDGSRLELPVAGGAVR